MEHMHQFLTVRSLNATHSVSEAQKPASDRRRHRCQEAVWAESPAWPPRPLLLGVTGWQQQREQRGKPGRGAMLTHSEEHGEDQTVATEQAGEGGHGTARCRGNKEGCTEQERPQGD